MSNLLLMRVQGIATGKADKPVPTLGGSNPPALEFQ